MSDDFDALFDRFTATAHRLEALPAYAAPHEDPGVRAFREGTARPERSVRTSPWMARLAVTTVGGRRWSRTRVVDEPLTDYQRYELVGYVESQAVGEEIRLITRAHVLGELLDGDIGPDFWLFDAAQPHPFAAVMRYDRAGVFGGVEVVRDAARLDALCGLAALLHRHALPLAEYLAPRQAAIRG